MRVRPLFLKPAEQFRNAESKRDRHNEKYDDHNDRTVDRCLKARKTADCVGCARFCDSRYDRQNNNSDYVVDNRGGNNGRSEFRIDLAEFFQNGDGDRNRRCRQNRADKDATENICSTESDIAEGKRDQDAQNHGDSNSRASDQRCGKSRIFQFLDIRFKSRRKHNENYAYFCKDGETVFAKSKKRFVFRSRKKEKAVIFIALESKQ